MTSNDHDDVSELLLRPAAELAHLIRDGVISARELLEATHRHVDHVNGSINAIVTTDWQRALDDAEAADAALAAGRRLGALHGVPVTIKDSFETADMRTTAGAAELSGYIPTADAVVVARLRAAGAIVIGKTNLPAWASDCQTFNAVFGTTNNPWDLSRTPGGSSGGGAAAVATGMTAVDVGSDLGGSVRIPAHFCGIYGLKPTYGLVPLRGHIPPQPGARATLDIATPGPLARSADDLAVLLDVLAGPDDADAAAWRLCLPNSRAQRLSDFRVGIWAHDPFCPVDAATTAAMDDLAERLRNAGCTVENVAHRLPSLAEGTEVFRRLIQWLAALSMSNEELADLAARGAAGDEWGRNVTLTAAAYHAAREDRSRIAVIWAELFRDVDVVLTPVMPGPAFPHDQQPDHDARHIVVDGELRPYGEQFGWLQAVGVVHLPAVVAPLGRSAGLPIGIQIVGPYLEDHTAIHFARRLIDVGMGDVPPATRATASDSRIGA